MDLLTRFSSVVGGMAPTGRRQRVALIPRDPMVGSIVMDLLTRFSSVVGGMAPTGRRQSVVPIPRNSIENSLRKLVKNI